MKILIYVFFLNLYTQPKFKENGKLNMTFHEKL